MKAMNADVDAGLAEGSIAHAYLLEKGPNSPAEPGDQATRTGC
jgi:hypothetical protein